MNRTPLTQADSGSRGATPGRGAPFAVATMVLALIAGLHGAALAAPAGGTVAAGGATISSAGAVTTINQTTARTAIHWQSFGIAAGESVNFVQPSSSSVALNRVLGPNPSAIFGNLTANGQVFLVNPNGVLFGAGASVNVGGLVASTLSIADADFMAGRSSFSGSSRAAVTNEGTITATGGYIALLGAEVVNQGTLSAPMGSIALAAGQALTLDLTGDKLLNVKVDQGAVNALARNGGLIQADGGQVLMTAQAAGSLLSTVVNNTGVIQAQSLQNQNGSIRLLGDMQSGTVSIGGTLDVSGPGAGQTGGTITATAYHVGLFAANIDASGQAGGGTVLVGGGYMGGNSAVPNASASYMSADSSIDANATALGDGGQVVVWGNDFTRAGGSISARGGAQGGNGGLIETSGLALDVAGIRVDAGAPKGKRGLWLLDPADIIIDGPATNGASEAGNVFTPNSGVSASNIRVSDITDILTAGTDVTVTTTNTGAVGGGSGDITIATALSWTSAAGASTLTLNAARDVNINADVTATRGNFVVCCGRDINVRADIVMTNGSLLLSAGRDVNVTRNLANPMPQGIRATDGNIMICAANDINLSSTTAAALITITDGSTTGGQSLSNLGVPFGLTLAAGTGGTGPGIDGGTLTITPPNIPTTVVVTNTPATITYNPVSYTAPSDFSGSFTVTGALGSLSQRMLVYPDSPIKGFDGTTGTVLSGLKGNPAGVTLVAGPGSIANFDNAAVGIGKGIGYTGYTLAGTDAARFALATTCCGVIESRTTGTIAPAAPLPFMTVLAPAGIVVANDFGSPLLVSATPETPMSLVVLEPTPVAPQPAVVAPAAREEPAPAAPARRPAKPFRN